MGCFSRRCNSQTLKIALKPFADLESEAGSVGGLTVIKRFGDFQFDDQRRRLETGGRPVRLTGQVVELLCFFLERPGELLAREEIERRLWPDRTVDFGHSIDVVVSRLRTILGDKGPHSRYIETVPRRGYRFIGPVTTIAERARTNVPHGWKRRLATYAAVAILAACVAILVARTRYEKVVAPGGARASEAGLSR
jgi:DNA-binding winged helix-turn-helix (wHTH) protein